MHHHLLLLFLRTHHRSIQLTHLFLTPHSPRWKGLILLLKSCVLLDSAKWGPKERMTGLAVVLPKLQNNFFKSSAVGPGSIGNFRCLWPRSSWIYRSSFFYFFFSWSEVYVLRAYVLHLVDSLRAHPVGFFFLQSLCVTDLHTGFDCKQ